MISPDKSFAFGRVVWERGFDKVGGIDLETMRGLVFLATECKRKIPAVKCVRELYRTSLPASITMLDEFADYFNKGADVKKLYLARTDDCGEVEGIFDDNDKLLHFWAMNDAHWREEYFEPLMNELGFEVISCYPERQDLIERLEKEAKKTWGF